MCPWLFIHFIPDTCQASVPINGFQMKDLWHHHLSYSFIMSLHSGYLPGDNSTSDTWLCQTQLNSCWWVLVTSFSLSIPLHCFSFLAPLVFCHCDIPWRFWQKSLKFLPSDICSGFPLQFSSGSRFERCRRFDSSNWGRITRAVLAVFWLLLSRTIYNEPNGTTIFWTPLKQGSCVERTAQVPFYSSSPIRIIMFSLGQKMRYYSN